MTSCLHTCHLILLSSTLVTDRLNAGVISCAGALVFLSQLLAKLATAAKSVLGRGAAAIISFCRRGTLERKPSNSDKEAPEAEKESDSGSSCSDVDYPDPDDVDALVCDLGHEAPTAQCDANIWLSRTASLKTKRRASLVDSARGSLPTVSYSAVE